VQRRFHEFEACRRKQYGREVVRSIELLMNMKKTSLNDGSSVVVCSFPDPVDEPRAKQSATMQPCR
jgi:hypothetical protein